MKIILNELCHNYGHNSFLKIPIKLWLILLTCLDDKVSTFFSFSPFHFGRAKSSPWTSTAKKGPGFGKPKAYAICEWRVLFKKNIKLAGKVMFIENQKEIQGFLES